MKYLSVCAGIEAATQGWHHLGWEPVAFSEIEPFPSAVLQHHYPNVPNWGDMTQFKTWPDATIDVLVGGTPCQSFSVAGLRKGLEDPRGNLMLTFLGIADRYKPKWIVWENVPGVLSSNGGRDFGTFLAALGELGYGWAYRVLDAQWFGVAQRRRRVFVVGCLGDQRSAAAVLFESESVSRHPAPSREARKGTASNAQASVAASCADVCATLGTEMSKQVTNQMLNQPESWFHPVLMRQREGKDGGGKGPLISEEKSLTLATSNDQVLAQPMAFAQNQLGEVRTGEVLNTLNTNSNDSGRNTPMVAQPMAFDTYNQTVNHHTSQTIGSSASDVNHYGAVLQPVPTSNDQVLAFRDPSPTITSKMQGASGWAPYNEDAHLVGVQHTSNDQVLMPPVGFDVYNQQETGEVSKVVASRSDADTASIVFQPVPTSNDQVLAQPVAFDVYNQKVTDDKFGIVREQHGTNMNAVFQPIPTSNDQVLMHTMQVRRLTPVECERLQGFPDNFTRIPWKRKPADDCPDGPRYKALGNSMAVPCMRWIGERINKQAHDNN
jgi:DNA-cytosine methyltransferase